MTLLQKIDLNEVNYALCRKDYGFYVDYVHKGRYVHGKFTRFLCKAVQEFIETETGNAYDILLLSVPPQHSKSMTITETLPSWVMGKYPTWRIIEASYNSDFAKRFTKRNAEKIDQFGKQIFGIQIGSTSTADEFELSNKIGKFISRGIMGGITGEPAELVIIDDPVKNREEADSPNQREKIFDEWMNSIKSRFQVGTKIIVIMTRWHEQDLYGKLLETEKNVTRLNFPIECETETDVLGRKRGDLLFPEQPVGKDRKWWDDFKRSYITANGSRALYSLYYGRPSAQEGGLFKRDWIVNNLYDELPSYAYKFISVDATFKDSKKSDFVSIQVWIKTGVHYYLVDRKKRIMGFVDTVKEIEELISKHGDYNALFIEDKANGSAIIDVLKRKYRSVIPVQTDGGKEARANAVSPMAEAGLIHLRRLHDGDMVEELCSFPNSDHDDDVDAMTQGINKTKDIVAQMPEKKKFRDYTDEANDVLGFTGD